MRLKITIILLLSLAVYGCATMNADECRTADWQAVGYEDGSRGYSFDRFRRHRKACAEHGVSAELHAYKRGYNEGVRNYCTAERGYQLAKSNKRFPRICPADTVDAVRRGYALGKDIYLQKAELYDEIEILEDDIEAIDDEISGLLDEKREHEKYLKMAENGLNDTDAKDSERLVVYTERAELRKLIREVDEEISLLEEDRRHYRDLIQDLRHQIDQLDNRPMPRSK